MYITHDYPHEMVGMVEELRRSLPTVEAARRLEVTEAEYLRILSALDLEHRVQSAIDVERVKMLAEYITKMDMPDADAMPLAHLANDPDLLGSILREGYADEMVENGVEGAEEGSEGR